MKNIFLLRYDTERGDQDEMGGFFDKIIAVHREEEIPATFFCTGSAIEDRESDFKHFFDDLKDDPLFDIQDHSYSHIGIGYADGMDVDDLKADYQRSFDAHERVFGRLPIGVAICGTGGEDGERLNGFDETEKGRQELNMLADLGVRMINSHLVDLDEATQFCNFAALGHPDIMGFPSGYSDTDWLLRKDYNDGMDFVYSKINEHAETSVPMPLMLHDWVTWSHAPDKELTHVKKIADYARKKGYELKTHLSCYQSPTIWK
ncbi:MAG: polysaccharide deacetylase family protein [Lentisphaeria bacterium]|nr:polysaccharide deacetylase family protein [Lentisphaeria bacterium]